MTAEKCGRAQGRILNSPEQKNLKKKREKGIIITVGKKTTRGYTFQVILRRDLIFYHYIYIRRKQKRKITVEIHHVDNLLQYIECERVIRFMTIRLYVPLSWLSF